MSEPVKEAAGAIKGANAANYLDILAQFGLGYLDNRQRLKLDERLSKQKMEIETELAKQQQANNLKLQKMSMLAQMSSGKSNTDGGKKNSMLYIGIGSALLTIAGLVYYFKVVKK